MEIAGPVVQSLRYQVEALLDGRAEEIGLEAPSPPQWIDGFFAFIQRETGARFDEHPSDFVERARFRVHVMSLGAADVAASTARDLWIPRQADRHDQRLAMLHEFIHGMLKRRGDERGEADAWTATAVWVARAALTPGGRGITVYPQWMILASVRVWARKF